MVVLDGNAQSSSSGRLLGMIIVGILLYLFGIFLIRAILLEELLVELQWSIIQCSLSQLDEGLIKDFAHTVGNRILSVYSEFLQDLALVQVRPDQKMLTNEREIIIEKRKAKSSPNTCRWAFLDKDQA